MTLESLRGKKTIVGSLLAGLVTVLYAVDRLFNDSMATPEVETWLSAEVYVLLAGLIVSFTGVSLRLAVRDGEAAAADARHKAANAELAATLAMDALRRNGNGNGNPS